MTHRPLEQIQRDLSTALQGLTEAQAKVDRYREELARLASAALEAANN